MNKRLLALGACVGLAMPACKDSASVTDLNNVPASTLDAGLNRAANALLATGFLDASRREQDIRYMVFAESMGRDYYRLDNAEKRWITELVQGPSDYSAFTGAGAFTQFYVTIRAGNTILNALPKATGVTSQEVLATQGLVNTFKALSYYRALTMRDSLGIAFDVNHPVDDAPAPFVCKPNVLASISALLDTAETQLAGGGTSFPFVLPLGFYKVHGDFSTPAAMRKFAKGLHGEIELYRGLSHQKPNPASFATAVADLNASFIDPAGGMDTGIYYTYSTATNDLINQRADANLYLNPFVGDSIQPGDKRASKIVKVPAKTLFKVTTTYKSPLNDATDLTSPLPVMKNSELLLLRAQAEIELNDFVSAARDINAVRVADGGLPPIAVPTSKAAAITAVLYEKRYSLLTEGAQRLVDLRAYSRLDASAGPGAPGDTFQSAFPIPKSQLDARNVTSITPLCP